MLNIIAAHSQILDALCFIHQPRQGIKFAHGDLKPSNIFFALGEEELIKIGDFGIIKGDKIIKPMGMYRIIPAIWYSRDVGSIILWVTYIISCIVSY